MRLAYPAPLDPQLGARIDRLLLRPASRYLAGAAGVEGRHQHSAPKPINWLSQSELESDQAFGQSRRAAGRISEAGHPTVQCAEERRAKAESPGARADQQRGSQTSERGSAEHQGQVHRYRKTREADRETGPERTQK
jgi:hypothetical protein